MTNAILGTMIGLTSTLVFGLSGAAAEAISIVPSKDNTLYESSSGSLSNGSGTTFFVGRTGQGSNSIRRGLIAFDVAAEVPAGVFITSVTLTLQMSRTPTNAGTDVSLHPALIDWGEGESDDNRGEGAGTSAQLGDATWIHTFFETDFWQTPGGDFAAEPSATTTVGPVGTYAWTSDQMVTDVQSWLDSPETNYGWILIGLETTRRTAKRFSSRENIPSAPQLTIEFDATPTFGACCDERTGECVEGVERRLCFGVGLRYGGTDSLCSEFDPTCAIAFGPCCDETSGECTDAVSLAICERVDLRFAGNGMTCESIVPSCSVDRIPILLVPLATGFSSPLMITHAGDGSGRRFVLDQTGRIWIITADDQVVGQPFLDISAKLVTLGEVFDERGLLGLAFHPNYATNGRFFIRYSRPREGVPEEPCNDPEEFVVGCHTEVLAEYAVFANDTDVADPDSERVLFEVDEPQFNHNAGGVAFGPDGFLYFSLGDGGGANDGLHDDPPSHGPIGNGQNIHSPLGTLLRIDVDGGLAKGLAYAIPPGNPFVGVDGLDEIFAYGMRNPVRFSWDDGPGGDGALYLADVGQDLYEEVNIIERGGNYGWVSKEGLHCFDPFDPIVPLDFCTDIGPMGEPLIDPIIEYGHPTPELPNAGGLSVLGGFVYRGSEAPDLVGRYVFADFGREFFEPTGRILYFDTTGRNAGKLREFVLIPYGEPLGRFVKGLGRDEEGELYVLASDLLAPSGATGVVYKIFGQPAPEPLVPDMTDVLSGKNRYVSFSAPGEPAMQAIRITLGSLDGFDAFNGEQRWVGAPGEFTDEGRGTFTTAALQCEPYFTDWTGFDLIHVYGAEIVPSSTYVAQRVGAACPLSDDEACFSDPLIVTTGKWADVAAPFGGAGQPDWTDMAGMVDKFLALATAPSKARAQLQPNAARPSFAIDFSDIAANIDAFTGRPYPFAGPTRCPTNDRKRAQRIRVP